MSYVSENPSLAECIEHGVETAMGRLFKAGPGIVKAYDPLTNTAFVRPAVKRAFYSGTTGERSFKEPPEIPFVPVIWPRAGGMVMRMPVLPGDTVLLVYCDAGLAEWREQGGVTEPEDARRHSMAGPRILGSSPTAHRSLPPTQSTRFYKRSSAKTAGTRFASDPRESSSRRLGSHLSCRSRSRPP
jgi:hypothetical protein